METTSSPTSMPRNGIKHGRASSIALPLSLGVGGIMKQRPVILESSLGPAQSSSAPAHLSLLRDSVASPVDATRKADIIKFHRKNRHETTIASLASLAMRGLFLLALVAFLRALLGLDPLPLQLGPFADHVATAASTTRSPFHHRAIRVIRAAHENIDHAHPLAVDLDGHVTLAQDFTDGLQPTARIDVNVKWPWASAVGSAQGSDSTQGATRSTTVPDEEEAVDMREGPPVAEGAVVHPLRILLPNEQTQDDDVARERWHGRRKGARYSYY